MDRQTVLRLATANPGQFARTVSRGNWQWAKHLRTLSDLLLAAAMGRETRLLIEAPPRHGKSQLSTVFYPAWVQGRFPGRNILVTSATKELATSFSTQSRDCFAEWGPSLFGQSIRTDIHAKDHWETSTGGSVRAIGAGSSVFGRGADLIVIDDYFGDIKQSLSETERKAIHQWYYGTIRNRLEPGGSIVVVASRTNADDLNGKLWKDSLAGGERWQRYSLPAIGSDGAALWPERWPLSALEALRGGYTSSGFPWMWDWLFQQDGPAVLDSEWDQAYFQDHIWYTTPPDPNSIIWRVLALDPSVGESEKSDYSAYIMLSVDRELNLWVDADLQRRDVYRIVNDGLAWYRHFHPQTFGVETVAFQKVLLPIFRTEAERAKMLINVSGVTHGRNEKRQRIRSTITPALAQRRLKFRKGSPGCAMLVQQLQGFPACKFDDGPDGLEIAVSLAARAVNSGVPFGAEKIAQEWGRVRA